MAHHDQATSAGPIARGHATETPIGYFYRAVWRWHFYAGLFVIPFMLVLAITGIVYLFKPQLDGWMYADRLFVAPGSQTVAAESQLELARARFPGATALSVIPPPAANRSTQVNLALTDGREMAVFIDPYTGRVLGERNERTNIQYYALTLHAELMAGKVGDRLIELAACWGLVLLVTGGYLWWPRDGGRLWGVWLPRLQRRNPRIFWRDLHAVTGVYAVPLIAFLLITGLPWTGVWGESVLRIANRYPPAVYQTPESRPLTGSLNRSGGPKVVPWGAEAMPIPESTPDPRAGHRGHRPTAAGGNASVDSAAQRLSLDRALALARESGAPRGFTVTMPVGSRGVYTVSAVLGDLRNEMTFHMDQYSGAILSDARWSNYGVIAKALSLGIGIHEGIVFGLANQLLMLVAALAVVVMSLSGAVMWWRRRPAGRLGAPAIGPPLPLWKGAMAITIVMGLLLPLMGLSLVAVLALDYALISRIPGLRTVIG